MNWIHTPKSFTNPLCMTILLHHALPLPIDHTAKYRIDRVFKFLLCPSSHAILFKLQIDVKDKKNTNFINKMILLSSNCSLLERISHSM